MEIFHSTVRCMSELQNILGDCLVRAQSGEEEAVGGLWVRAEFFTREGRQICGLQLSGIGKTLRIYLNSGGAKILPVYLYALQGWASAIGIDCFEDEEPPGEKEEE